MFAEELLSVIVPVYNAEKYLAACIESIINQTYDQLEILLIDDGSTDRSGQICDQYAERDERIRVIHKKNEGLLRARKDGVLSAKGNMITFVDADDWIESVMYEELITILLNTDSDMISSGVIMEYQATGKRSTNLDHYPEKLYDHLDRDIYPTMLWDYGINTSGMLRNAVLKIFKRDILAGILRNMDLEVSIGEDCLICTAYILQIKTMYVCHKAFYHYNIHEESMCSTVRPEIWGNVQRLYTELERVITEYENPAVLTRQLKRYILEIVEHAVGKLFDIRLNRWRFEYDRNVFERKYVIYGAGNCGIGLYRMLCQDGLDKNMVAWIDRRAESIGEICGNKISLPEHTKTMEYDHIIIAIKEKDTADSVRGQLCNVYGIEPRKIVWEPVESESIFTDFIF